MAISLAAMARTTDDPYFWLGGIANAETQVLHGDPAEQLVRAALDLQGDLIVLGVRRAGPLHALMSGSLTMRVIDGAPCPVALSH